MSIQKAIDALKSLTDYADSLVCRHENTHRGGAIWEICDDCGAKWADDRGGKPNFEEPAAIKAAREAIASLEAPQPERAFQIPQAWLDFVGDVADDTMLGYGLRNWAKSLLAGEPVAARPVQLPQIIEAIAKQWDGCIYQVPGDELDIGVSIREAYKFKLAAQPETPPGMVRVLVKRQQAMCPETESVCTTCPSLGIACEAAQPLQAQPLTEDDWLDLAQRHANKDWDSHQPDGYLNAVKALCEDFAAITKTRGE